MNTLDGQSATAPRPRVVAFDALRGVAVLLMLEQHLGSWLVDRTRYLVAWPYVVFNMLGGAAAPLFVTLAGAGSVHLAQKAGASSVSFKRGVGLLALAYAMNFLVSHWFTWATFYVLHLLAVWLMVAPFVLRMATTGLVLSGALSLTCAAMGQWALGTPLSLHNYLLSYARTPGEAARLVFFEGHFPLFPWLAFCFAGVWIGRQFLQEQQRNVGRFTIGTAVVGGALFGVGQVSLPFFDNRLWQAVSGFSFYPATTAFVLLLLSVCGVLLLVADWLVKRDWLKDTSLLVALGRASLSVFVLHIVLVRQVADDLGWLGQLPPMRALGTLLLFIGNTMVLVGLWRQVDYRFGIEWCLRKISKPQESHN